jgi:hypothetical protein
LDDNFIDDEGIQENERQLLQQELYSGSQTNSTMFHGGLPLDEEEESKGESDLNEATEQEEQDKFQRVLKHFSILQPHEVMEMLKLSEQEQDGK